MVFNRQVAFAHKLYYVPTDVPSLAGWVRGYDHGYILKALEQSCKYLEVEKLPMEGGGQHWGWVKASSLLEFTRDETAYKMLLRFYLLADCMVEDNFHVAASELSRNAMMISVRGINGSLRLFWEAQAFNPDKVTTYLSAGFAKDIMHCVMSAQRQGVAPENVRLERRLVDPADRESGMMVFVQNAQGFDLPKRPLFYYLTYKP